MKQNILEQKYKTWRISLYDNDEDMIGFEIKTTKSEAEIYWYYSKMMPVIYMNLYRRNDLLLTENAENILDAISWAFLNNLDYIRIPEAFEIEVSEVIEKEEVWDEHCYIKDMGKLSEEELEERQVFQRHNKRKQKRLDKVSKTLTENRLKMRNEINKKKTNT